MSLWVYIYIYFWVYRLYSQALESQTKLGEARKARDAEMSLNAQGSSHRMTWVSQELTKGRTTGEYSNYGERLYVEGMLEHEKKKAAVKLCLTLKRLLQQVGSHTALSCLTLGESFHFWMRPKLLVVFGNTVLAECCLCHVVQDVG